MSSVSVISVLIAVLLAIGVNAPDANKTEVPYTEILLEYMSVDDTIAVCSNIVMGRLTSVEIAENQRMLYFHFDVLDEFKGHVTDKQITVRQARAECTYEEGNVKFLAGQDYKAGRKYIIMLYKSDTVYDSWYGFSNYVCIPTDGERIGEVTVMTIPEKVGFTTVGEFRDHVDSITAASPSKDAKKKYIISDDLHEIADFADMIVKIRVNAIDRSNPSNRELIDCTVLDIYKGEPGGGFYPIVFDDTVEENKEYYMFLMYNGQYPTLAARDAVYPVDTISIEEYIN